MRDDVNVIFTKVDPEGLQIGSLIPPRPHHWIGRSRRGTDTTKVRHDQAATFTDTAKIPKVDRIPRCAAGNRDERSPGASLVVMQDCTI